MFPCIPDNLRKDFRKISWNLYTCMFIRQERLLFKYLLSYHRNDIQNMSKKSGGDGNAWIFLQWNESNILKCHFLCRIKRRNCAEEYRCIGDSYKQCEVVWFLIQSAKSDNGSGGTPCRVTKNQEVCARSPTDETIYDLGNPYLQTSTPPSVRRHEGNVHPSWRKG
jgi:hypothetical protein